MTTVRKEPRVNLRFKGFDLLDQLEIVANGKGLTLPEYCRRALRASLTETAASQMLERTQLESILTTQKLLEFSLPAEQVAQAKNYTKDYLLKVKSHAASSAH